MGVIFDHSERDIFDETHHRFREQVRRFYAAEIEPNVAAWEKAGGFPRQLFRRAAAASILAPGLPEEYSGGVRHGLPLAGGVGDHGPTPAGPPLAIRNE